MPKKKVDLEQEANATAYGAEPEKQPITDEELLEICPKTVLSSFKKAKTAAQRADLLYVLDRENLRELRKVFQEMELFVNKLEAWFLQEIVKQNGQTGISGKQGRVEVKEKEVYGVNDWDAFYEYVRKKKAYELLQRRLSDKAIKERREQGVEVPGTYTFKKPTISLTGVKK